MQKTLKAKDIMEKNVITIGPDVMLDKAIQRLLENRISGMPVVDDNGKIIGIISEKDILNFLFCGYLHNTTVSEAMTENLVHFDPETRIEKIAIAISKYQFRRVPILQDSKVVGIVSRRDIIRHVL
ncbi:MAG: CBS domain-containing protein [Candidatus Cloacimonetes bacterium]|nr:CBS domain-containing protein [Candidatus Cloacimonadota bacterium]